MNLFERLPNELIEHILLFTEDYTSIAARVCFLWSTLVDYRKLNIEAITNVKLLIWANKNIGRKRPRKRICINCAKRGYLDVLTYLSPQSSDWIYSLYEYAVEGGHIDILVWLYSQASPGSWTLDMSWNIATEKGYHKVLEWLESIKKDY